MYDPVPITISDPIMTKSCNEGYRVEKIARIVDLLIEVNNSVVELYSLDEKQPEREEIYRALRGLTKSLRSSEYLPDLMELEQGG